MWLLKAPHVLVLLLWGCSPLLSPHSEGVKEKLGLVKVGSINDRMGQYMFWQLQQHLPESGGPPLFFLKIELNKHKRTNAYSSGGFAVRDRLTSTAKYTLKDKEGRVLTTGTLLVHGSYSLIEDEYLAVSSAQKATEEANIDRLVTYTIYNLALYFREHPGL